MKEHFKKVWKDESGATAIEYSLIAGIMAAVLITVLGAFSDQLSELFNAITDKLLSITDTIKEE